MVQGLLIGLLVMGARPSKEGLTMLSPPPSRGFGAEDRSAPLRATDHERAVAAAFSVFLASLARSRSRLTHARLRVARWLLEASGPFSEDEVNAWLAERGLPIGRRSVQNTLSLLVESGLMLRLHRHEDREVYIPLVPRGKPEDSLLILCVRCADVKEVPVSELPELRAAIAAREHFQPAFAVHLVRAVCRRCREAAANLR